MVSLLYTDDFGGYSMPPDFVFVTFYLKDNSFSLMFARFYIVENIRTPLVRCYIFGLFFYCF